jgi:hypothetical protein
MLLFYICTEYIFLFIGAQIDPGQQTATYAHSHWHSDVERALTLFNDI